MAAAKYEEFSMLLGILSYIMYHRLMRSPYITNIDESKHMLSTVVFAASSYAITTIQLQNARLLTGFVQVSLLETSS